VFFDVMVLVLTQPAGNDHHLFDRLAGDVLLHVGVRHRQLLDGGAVGVLRHAQTAAQLAVDLHHEFDLVGVERRGVGLGPRRGEDILAVAQFAPQRVGDVRGDRCEQAQQQAEPFSEYRASRVVIAPGRTFHRVEHFHRRRDDRVELELGEIVVGLLEGEVDLAAHRGKRGRQLAVGERAGTAPPALLHFTRKAPQPLEKTRSAFDARIRPLERLLGRTGEHHEQARGVSAVFLDQRLRIDAVVL
jgi:hypothetical protein